MNAKIGTLADQLVRFKDTLYALEHDLWRSSLPSDYQPLSKSSRIVPLHLSPADSAELRMRIVQTRLSILDVITDLQTIQLGKPDEWVDEERAILRAQLRGVWLLEDTHCSVSGFTCEDCGKQTPIRMNGSCVECATRS